MQLPFGEWLPDQPEHLNPGATVATNVFFAATSYKPVKGLVPYTGTSNITKNAKGAGSFRDNNNTVFTFVATRDTIYQLAGGVFTDKGAGGKLLNNSFATCTITVSDYANIGAGKTITLRKNDNSIVTFTSVQGTQSTNQFNVTGNNSITATNLKTSINANANFSATVTGAVVTVTRATIGRNNLINVSSDTARLTTTNFIGGTPLLGADTDFITFTQFGNHVIATNGVNAPQYFLMGTSTAFVDLQTLVTASGSGTVPSKFRTSGVIRDFLVTGNIENAKNRVAWSGINDISTWEAGVSSSDFQDLPGAGGEVVAITSGEIGYVFRQDQIVRMDFVGGNVVFRFSVISPNRGAVFSQGVCQDNRQVFFYSSDGFFQINGDEVTPIGAEKVNRFFDADLNKAYTDRISAAVDPFNTLAIWLYPSKDNPNVTGLCDKLLIYNYVTQKWSIAKIKASQIFKQFIVVDTVELMDIISADLDQINISLDTSFWTNGHLYLGGINEDFKAAIFSGKNLEAEIETKETELFPGKRANITNVRPIVDATSNVTIKTRNKLADAVTTSPSSPMNDTGINPVRQSGRYFRANVKIPAETIWSDAQGVDLIAVPGGDRWVIKLTLIMFVTQLKQKNFFKDKLKKQ